MRLAGTLNDEQLAQRFGSYLRAREIDNRIEQQRSAQQRLELQRTGTIDSSSQNSSQPTVWEIWIRNDDQWSEAQTELAEFVKNPSHERFSSGQSVVATVVSTAAKTAGRPYSVYDPVPFQFAPWISWFCVMLCMAVYMVINTDEGGTVYEKQKTADQEQRLLYEPRPASHKSDVPFAAIKPFAAIRSGEVWRIFTPSILHGGILHLFMNMMVLMSQGVQIERIRGPAIFGGLVLALSAISNTAQYTVNIILKDASPGAFVGFSGVLFGLFGYRLAKSRWEPRLGLHVMEQEVVFMLCWLFLGVLDLVPGMKIANTCHISGWIAGMALAYLGTLWNRRTSFAS